jgi:integrase/recombinase XerD
MTLDTSTAKNLQEAFDEHIRNKRINNVTDKTIRNYEDCFKYFSEYVGAHTNCAEITHDTVMNYIEYLKKTREGISYVSINTYLRGLRTFLYFCMEQEYMKHFKIALTHAEKPLKETYTESELEKLLKKPNIKKCSFSEYRNWVLVCYLLGTGNRRKTVCNLKICDLDFDSHEISLRAVKNKKHYTIPLSGFLEKVLREYLTYRKGSAEDFVFCNSFGQQLTLDGFNTVIERYNISRGVAKTGLHLFRHTFAKKWILNRGDPFRLKAILGHSTMAMVNEYVNMFGKDLQKDFDVFSPLDSMECIKRSNGHIKLDR